MPSHTARVSCPVCRGDRYLDMRDDRALLAEHMEDAQLARLRKTAWWQAQIVPCDECSATGLVPLGRALALDTEARDAVRKALQTIDSPKEGT